VELTEGAMSEAILTDPPVTIAAFEAFAHEILPGIAPMVVYLLSDKARQVTGQVYTVSGGKIAVWNQPVEARAMFKDGRWTPEEIEARLPGTVGVERMGLIDRLEQMRTLLLGREIALDALGRRS
jgi:hypothetical protein